MPNFGGFVTNSFTGALVRNAVGTVANSVFPRTAFGGLGGAISNLVGQNLIGQDADNRRATLKPRPGGANTVYGNGILNPLKAAGGLVWPYTPTISYSSDVDYQPMQTVHTNQDFHMYSKTPAVTLSVAGDFTVQNQQEGQYALAAIHFLRTMSKMNFGDTDPLAGTPPPILLFNAYGPFVFNNVPVIVKGFNIDFPDQVDYVQVTVQGTNSSTTTTSTPARTTDTRVTAENLPPLAAVTEPILDDTGATVGTRTTGGASPYYYNAGPARSVGNITTIPGTSNTSTRNTPVTYKVWLPSQFKISVTLITQHTPKTLRSRFNLSAYRNGATNQSDFI